MLVLLFLGALPLASTGVGGYIAFFKRPVFPGTTGGYLPTAPGRSIDELLSQFRKEPANEEECAAKFMLYDAWPNFAIFLCSHSLNRFPPG